jgi:hypothetical protein
MIDFKPTAFTNTELVLEHLLGQLIAEQKKTNELLEQLVPKKEVTDDTPRNARRRKSTD